VKDNVEYGALGGSIVQRFLIAPDLERIFVYRQRVLHALFGTEKKENPNEWKAVRSPAEKLGI
jgi:hypothetical protein